MAGRHRRELGSDLADVFSFLRPIFAQQTRKRAIRQQPPACLTTRTIGCLVSRVTNALNLRAAARTRLAVTAVRRHVFAEGSDFFREAFAGFFTQTLDPF